MAYLQGWLNYRHISDENMEDIIIYSSVSGNIIERIYEELSLGFERMYHRKVRRSTANSGTQKGVILTIKEGMKGYCLNCNRGIV
jgi:hypothetical protein